MSLGSYFRHSRSRRYANFEGVPGNLAISDADAHLLASDRLGGLLLLVCIQSWWAMFELRNYQPWTFAAFAVVLLQTILTYVVAGLVFPDLFGERIVDLRESFYAHRVWFFALGLFVIL